MKKTILIIFIATLCIAGFAQDKKGAEQFNETYRPQYHFTPVENRMGSPISIITVDSTYHLYYQWNPHNLQQGFVNWGHATSHDLLKWEHKEIVLSQPTGVSDSMAHSPWWGSVSSNGTQLYAWATRWDDGIYRHNAIDANQLGEGEKTITDKNLNQSEPFVFWHKPTEKWVMAAYSRTDSMVNFLNSSDGIKWEKTSSFRLKYGFVSLTEIAANKQPDSSLWLLIAENGNYMIGNFDGKKFENLTSFNKFDYGEMVGGSLIFKDLKNNRHLLFSEIKSEQQPDLPANGQLTFPTEIILKETNTGLELHHKPIEEIKQLYKKSFVTDNKKIYPGINNNPLQSIKGDCFHMKGTIDLKNCDMFGIIIRGNRENEGINLSYNTSRKMFEIEGSRFTYSPKNNKVDIELLIDRSSVEVFIEGGRYVISTPMIPEPKNLKYNLYSTGGEVFVEHFEVHELKSAWQNK